MIPLPQWRDYKEIDGRTFAQHGMDGPWVDLEEHMKKCHSKGCEEKND